MSDLGDKLHDILDGWTDKPLPDEVLEEIKQAFADAGYVHLQSTFGIRVKEHAVGYMTGQEWYERFEKELDAKPDYVASIIKPKDTNLFARNRVMKAAKRAAGIEEYRQQSHRYETDRLEASPKTNGNRRRPN